MGEIAISEKFLLDTGGWQEVKHAKALVEMGRVVSFNYSSQVLRGLVREGETEFRAGLKIASYTDVENLCSCRDSREWGKICAHSLAVGLALINSKIPAKEKVARAVGCLPNLVNSADATGALASSATPIELHIVLAPNLESAWERGQLMVGFEVLSRGNRQLASALNPKQTFSGSQMDIEILTRASGMAGGQMPGMTILGRDEFLKLIGTLINHPRVTIARKLPVTISSENLLPALRVKQLEDKRWEIRADCSSLKGKLLLGSQSAWDLVRSNVPTGFLRVAGNLSSRLPFADHAKRRGRLKLCSTRIRGASTLFRNRTRNKSWRDGRARSRGSGSHIRGFVKSFSCEAAVFIRTHNRYFWRDNRVDHSRWIRQGTPAEHGL